MPGDEDNLLRLFIAKNNIFDAYITLVKLVV